MNISDIEHLLSNPIIGAGTIMTVLGGLFYTLREVPKKLFGHIKTKVISKLVYTVRIYDYDDLFDILEKWLYDNHQKQYRDVQANISFRCSVEPPDQNITKKAPKVLYRQAPTMFTLKYSGKTIFVNKQDEKIDHATSFSSLYAYKYVIRGFNCRNEINLLLQDIVNNHYSALSPNSIRVRPNDDYGFWQTGNTITAKGLKQIILDDQLKNKIKSDIDTFRESKSWYTETGIPYKRTYCFYGPPGTGKTSISLAIAAYSERDIYILNLSSLRNDSAMQAAFSNISNNAVLLLEDIDSAFAKRESSNENISFSCLLNCLDGALYKEGLITCITTNHLDKLDEALLREGRTDMIFHINYPTVQQIAEYLSIFYQQSRSLHYRGENTSVPMSAIQEICLINREQPSKAIEQISQRIREGSNNTLSMAV
jgi:mitochondrial chaperone BCS1